MNLMPRTLALVLALALTLVACRDQAPVPDPGPTGDRTLEKLREEVEREQAARDDPNQRLAELAVGAGAPEALEGVRPLSPDARATVGPFAVRVVGWETSHRAAGNGKLSLTTEDWFVRVTVEATNADRSAQSADFNFARLAGGTDQPLELARDAQRVAGTRELNVELAPGEERELVLYFEAPAEAFGKGLTLQLPAAVAGNQDVQLPLEAT